MDKAGCVAVIRLNLGDRAKAILDSVEPDNASAPSWLRVECRASGGVIECIVGIDDCESPQRVLSLRNTVDDLLQSVKAALSALDNTVGFRG